jgi:hypothetical protein
LVENRLIIVSAVNNIDRLRNNANYEIEELQKIGGWEIQSTELTVATVGMHPDTGDKSTNIQYVLVVTLRRNGI